MPIPLRWLGAVLPSSRSGWRAIPDCLKSDLVLALESCTLHGWYGVNEILRIAIAGNDCIAVETNDFSVCLGARAL